MLRNLAVLLSALVAMSAQAGDPSTPKRKGEPAPAAPSVAKGKPRGTVVTSKGPVESPRPPLSPSVQPAQPKAGSAATTPADPNDCGMGQSFLDEGPIPVAIRFYNPPAPAASPREGDQPQAWTIPPSVFQAGRCHQKYVIQFKSESKELYTVKDAKLLGTDGEVLEVIGIRSRVNAANKSINIVTVKRTKSVEPDYRVAIELIGEDGRRFVLQNVELP